MELRHGARFRHLTLLLLLANLTLQVDGSRADDTTYEGAHQKQKQFALAHDGKMQIEVNSMARLQHETPPKFAESLMNFPGNRTWSDWVVTGKHVFSLSSKDYYTQTAVFMTISITCLCCLLGQWGCTEQEGHMERELGDLMEVHNIPPEQVPDFWADPIGLEDFKESTLRKALPKVAFSIFVWLSGLYFNNVCQAWLQQNMASYYAQRWEPRSDKKVFVMLWDMGYRILPSFPHSSITELFAEGAPVFVVIRFCVLPGPFSMRWTFLNRMFFMWGILWALRAITIVSTVLPNPDESCKPRVTYPDNVFMEAVANMPFVFWRHELTCQDVLFSGHTVILTLATLMWIYYVDWAPWPQWANSSSMGAFLFKGSVLLNMLAGYYCIIASKLHYTADVLMACMLTMLIFQGYHAALRSAFLPQNKRSSLLRSGLHSFMMWFDEDAADVALQRLLLLRTISSAPDKTH